MRAETKPEQYRSSTKINAELGVVVRVAESVKAQRLQLNNLDALRFQVTAEGHRISSYIRIRRAQGVDEKVAIDVCLHTVRIAAAEKTVVADNRPRFRTHSMFLACLYEIGQDLSLIHI